MIQSPHMTPVDAMLSSKWFRTIPKVELHLHLEGAMSLAALRALAHKYRVFNASALEWMLILGKRRYSDFHEFDRTWKWKNTLIRELEDFSFIAESAAGRLRADGVVYAEMSFCPSDFSDRGYTSARLIEAVRTGIDRVPNVDVALIVDLGRELGPVHAERQVRLGAELSSSCRVVGIGMGGLHGSYPTGAFAGAYRTAQGLGLRTTVHAGEVDGSDGVRTALEFLRPDRIGHGIGASGDPTLLDLLARERIPLEICPSSNVYTRTVAGFAQHPARDFLQRGIGLSLSTDDPVMFRGSLSREYALARTHLGFSASEIEQLLESSIAVSWMSAANKRERLTQLHRALRRSGSNGALDTSSPRPGHDSSS